MWKRLSSIQLDAISTTVFSEWVTQQGLWYETTQMSCELESMLWELDEPDTRSDSLCTT